VEYDQENGRMEREVPACDSRHCLPEGWRHFEGLEVLGVGMLGMFCFGMWREWLRGEQRSMTGLVIRGGTRLVPREHARDITSSTGEASLGWDGGLLSRGHATWGCYHDGTREAGGGMRFHGVGGWMDRCRAGWLVGWLAGGIVRGRCSGLVLNVVHVDMRYC
jgi:hypothetical protein